MARVSPFEVTAIRAGGGPLDNQRARIADILKRLCEAHNELETAVGNLTGDDGSVSLDHLWLVYTAAKLGVPYGGPEQIGFLNSDVFKAILATWIGSEVLPRFVVRADGKLDWGTAYISNPASGVMWIQANSAIELLSAVSVLTALALTFGTASRPLKLDGSKNVVSAKIDLTDANDVSGPLPVATGGTGATTAATARGNLDAAQGTGIGSGQFLAPGGGQITYNGDGAISSKTNFTAPIGFGDGGTNAQTANAARTAICQGVSATFDPNSITSMTFVDGVLTAYS